MIGRDDFQYLCPIYNEQRNEKGRPKFLIPRAQLVGLRSLNFTWKAISEMLGVSEKTIFRRRCEFPLPIGEDTYSSITDEELDEKISSILNSSPNSGERMVIGALTARNIKVKRERVRASIFCVDPVNRVLRRHTSIRRRVYSVPHQMLYGKYVLLCSLVFSDCRLCNPLPIKLCAELWKQICNCLFGEGLTKE